MRPNALCIHEAMARIKYSPQTTNNYKRAKEHDHHNPMSPSLTLLISSASRQKHYPKAVGETTPPLDTPGTFHPEETGHRKSYVAILTSNATNKEVSSLGHGNKALPPLASMATNPPSPKKLIRRRI